MLETMPPPVTSAQSTWLLSFPLIRAAVSRGSWFVHWRRPDGRSQPVIIVSFDLESENGGPWNLVDGTVEHLRLPDAVFIDRLYSAKLVVSRVGDTIEIEGRRAVSSALPR